MKVTVNEIELDVFLIKKKVKRTFIKIKHNRDIIITSPKIIKDNELKDIIRLNEAWILKQLSKIKEIPSISGYLVFGKEYLIETSDELTNDYKIFNNTILYDKNGLSKLELELVETIKIRFHKLLDMYQFNFTPKLIIKKMKSKWGVCHYKSNKVVINKVFIHLPLELLDYVIHHELTHFIVPNHSKIYYDNLGKRLPNHKELQKRLKSYIHLLSDNES